MPIAWLFPALALLAPGDQAATQSSPAAPTLEQRLREINREDAHTWEFFLDPERTAKAQFIEQPIYRWTNPTKGTGQYGSVFLWIHGGRPAVVGSFFGHPVKLDRRRMTHEFHLVAPQRLYPLCSDGDGQTWEPKSAIGLAPLPSAPPPEATPARRLLQMRNIGRQFGGYTVDWRKQRWELRLLPQPLYRYEKPPSDLLDGALLALVTDAGTDPEVLLLLEATKDEGWQYALLRFSDSSLYVTHQGKEIWTAIRGPEEAQLHNADHTYRVFQKRFLDELASEPGALPP